MSHQYKISTRPSSLGFRYSDRAGKLRMFQTCFISESECADCYYTLTFLGISNPFWNQKVKRGDSSLKSDFGVETFTSKADASVETSYLREDLSKEKPKRFLVGFDDTEADYRLKLSLRAANILYPQAEK